MAFVATPETRTRRVLVDGQRLEIDNCIAEKAVDCISVLESIRTDFAVDETTAAVRDQVVALLTLFDKSVFSELGKSAGYRRPVVVEVDSDYTWREDLEAFGLCHHLKYSILTFSHPLGAFPDRQLTPNLCFGVFSFTGSCYETVFSNHDIVTRVKWVGEYVVPTRDQFADPPLGVVQKLRTPLQAQRARVRSRDHSTRPMSNLNPAGDKASARSPNGHAITGASAGVPA